MPTMGTCYFLSRNAAFRYYRSQEVCAEDVKERIDEGSINIGQPHVKDGERLVLNQEEGRWMIILKGEKRCLT